LDKKRPFLNREPDRFEQLTEMPRGFNCPTVRVNRCGYKTVHANLRE